MDADWLSSSVSQKLARGHLRAGLRRQKLQVELGVAVGKEGMQKGNRLINKIIPKKKS